MTERRIGTFLAAAALAAGALGYAASAQAFGHVGGGFHAGGGMGRGGGFHGGMGGFHGGLAPGHGFGHGFGRGFGHRAFGFGGWVGYPYYAGDWGYYGDDGDCWQTQLVWNGYRWVTVCADY